MQPTPSERAALAANPWYASLAPALQRALRSAGERVNLADGEMLFRQGDPPGPYFALLAGALKVSSLREDGAEAILVVIEPGNWFGEISLLDGAPRTHDATALGGPAMLLAVPPPAFARLMRRQDFAAAMAGLLARRVRALYGMVEDATLRGPTQRVARRLALLARGDATQAAGARDGLPVTREALAMMLGMSRQTLHVALKALADEDIVRLGYGRVRIVDMAALLRRGEAIG